ncbi:MAG: epoxyqueuosine reductase QueH [Patescibacteria group bacterium]
MKLLLHLCCANCGLVPIELLKNQFELTLFWYNPNIYPRDEYKKRLTTAKELSKIYQLPLIIDKCEDKKWFELTQGLENKPEGGRRCEICFRMRLEKAAQFAKKTGFNFFTTTLGVSRYKNTDLINQIGQNLAEKYNLKYYSFALDKNKAAKQELELSKKYNFYRQKYCGCKMSKMRTSS